MKKYLILGVLALSTMSFAWGGHNNEYNSNCCNRGYSSHNNTRQNIQLTQTQQQMFRDYQIQISEKQLEIAKLKNSNNIDWTQIEKLNQEIAILRANFNTEKMKIRYSQN